MLKVFLITALVLIQASFAQAQLLSLGKSYVGCTNGQGMSNRERLIDFVKPMHGRLYAIKIDNIRYNIKSIKITGYKRGVIYSGSIYKGQVLLIDKLPITISAKCNVDTSQAFTVEAIWNNN